MITATTRVSEKPGTIHPATAFGYGFPHPEKDEPELSPEMREVIDKKIAISREQFKNGQYKMLDDGFMREFSEKACKRSQELLRKRLDEKS